MLQEELQKERDILAKIIARAQANLRDAPKGTLYVSSSHGRPQYLYRPEGSAGKSEYLGKDRRELVGKLAQRDYDEQVLKAAQLEIEALDKLSRKQPELGVAKIRSMYRSLSEARQALVTPRALTDDEFVSRWQAETFEQLAFGDGTALETDRGEKVRSKSELIIANKLAAAGIPYRYECRLQLGAKSIYPDFTILNARTRENVYWEHFGMMDDEKYVGDMMVKLETYARHGLVMGKQLVATFETSSKPLDTKMVDAYISTLFV